MKRIPVCCSLRDPKQSIIQQEEGGKKRKKEYFESGLYANT
jgi:hypothetical protein